MVENTATSHAMLAQTPPMGWNSWNGFAGNISEGLIHEIAEALITSGMRDAGYTYVVLDDHWQGGRGDDGRLFADPAKFPSGMKALADYLHERGLQFGIYSDAGTQTCGGEPGSQDHEEIDAQTFAGWDVDFLKYDFCNTTDTRAFAAERYSRMGRALQATGRPIVFSICEWGHHNPWEWGREAGGHLWRTTADMADSWEWTDPSIEWLNGLDSIGFDQQRGLERFAGPGGWNDPDMLIVGLFGKGTVPGDGCTLEEYRTHFSLWCLLAAPLMASCDLRTMSEEIRAIHTNHELIALNQDPLGRQGYRVRRYGKGGVWRKELQNGDIGIGLFNRETTEREIKVHWSNLGIAGPHLVRDLWAHQDLGNFDGEFSATVPPHGGVIVRLTPAR
jgi:alpha-galactosidase